MNSKRAIAAGIAAVFVVTTSGCATQPSNVQAHYVSSAKFESLDCKRLAREAEEIDIRLRTVTGTLQTKADTDAVIVGVGAILFWPVLLALPATGGKAEEQELGRLKGEADAVTRAMKDRNCGSTRQAVQESAAGAPVTRESKQATPPAAVTSQPVTYSPGQVPRS